jgi:hypothetical protein
MYSTHVLAFSDRAEGSGPRLKFSGMMSLFQNILFLKLVFAFTCVMCHLPSFSQRFKRFASWLQFFWL